MFSCSGRINENDNGIVDLFVEHKIQNEGEKYSFEFQFNSMKRENSQGPKATFDQR